jgi:hypothetical protein
MDLPLPPRTARDWARDLQDASSLTSASQGDVIPFELTSTPFETRMEDGTISTYPETDYLTLRSTQNAVAAEVKLQEGLHAEAARNAKRAQGLFQQGLELVPDHAGLLDALKSLSVPKKVPALKDKSTVALHDAVLERALGNGDAFGNGTEGKEDEKYPMLQSSDEDDRKQRKRRKRDKKKRQKQRRRGKRRRREDDQETCSRSDDENGDAEDDSDDDDDDSRKKRRKRKKKRRRRKHTENDNESYSSSSVPSTTSTVDSRTVTRRRRRKRERERMRNEPVEVDASPKHADSPDNHGHTTIFQY